jgi:hypothetical protein
MQWYTIDLHLHTPASSDYQQNGVEYLDILKRAEARGLDIIAFTDHNTVAGYRSMQEEIEQLELLEKLNRLLPEEKIRLTEYRRLLDKILVLPGFEFTATFGFHILGIFSPEKPVREIEHILLNLNIPAEQLDDGSVTVGASSDVLSAYKEINEAGGLVIAAHANANNGVSMRGFPFGGQTKIAYTQDSNLHALEVTDLAKGRRSTQSFFSGTKPEYPRRMHCIQGSDAHRVELDSQRKKNLGIGDRVTDVRLHQVSYDALKDLFASNDFARTRPHRQKAEPAFDFIQAAREEGSNIVQDFHESMTTRGGKLYAIIADVCGFANTNGGTLYVGLTDNPRRAVAGVQSADHAISQLEKEIEKRISPPLNCTIDGHKVSGKNIVRILIPRGDDPPYAVDDSKIYLRTEAETGLAVRDEIVEMVLRGRKHPPVVALTSESQDGLPSSQKENIQPRTGVEIVSKEERGGVPYYTVRDLRNGNVVKNVTRKSARKLWHQAITRYSQLPEDISKAIIQWQGDLGMLKRHKRGKSVYYDLVQRIPDGGFRTYFGVTEDGIHGAWKQVVGIEDQ